MILFGFASLFDCWQWFPLNLLFVYVIAIALALNGRLDVVLTVFFLCLGNINAEILRVSGMLPNQGFGDFDRRQHRSPSPMASANIMSNIHGGGYGGWNGLHQEVSILLMHMRIWRY